MSPLKLMLAIAAGLAAGSALGQQPAKPPPFDAANYPPEVRKALRYANEECARQQGGAVTFAPDTVRAIDLTGDGRDDYIVDFRDAVCADREAAYCGTGGCIMDILLKLPNGRVRRVFDGHIRSYEILPGDGARTIRFALHGGYCGGHGNPSCIKERRITAKPFEFTMPK
jgi:hypothetical protein